MYIIQTPIVESLPLKIRLNLLNKVYCHTTTHQVSPFRLFLEHSFMVKSFGWVAHVIIVTASV